MNLRSVYKDMNILGMNKDMNISGMNKELEEVAEKVVDIEKKKKRTISIKKTMQLHALF